LASRPHGPFFPFFAFAPTKPSNRPDLKVNRVARLDAAGHRN
jgi:hypothetical protein